MPRKKVVEVDLTLLDCLDMGHRWQMVEVRREHEGPLRGLARRELICLVCTGVKIEHLQWNGRVANRRYKSSKEYLTEARKLGDVYERRSKMREVLLKSIPR